MKKALITLTILPFLGAGCLLGQKSTAPELKLQVPGQEQQTPAQHLQEVPAPGQQATGPTILNPEPPDPTLKAGQEDYVRVLNQKAGIEVMMDYVLIHKRGFVVLHEDDNGQPGKIVAASNLLNAGEMREAFVRTKTEAGKTYWAMLHTDNGDGIFDAKTDLPIRDSKDAMVMARFKAE